MNREDALGMGFPWAAADAFRRSSYTASCFDHVDSRQPGREARPGWPMTISNRLARFHVARPLKTAATFIASLCIAGASVGHAGEEIPGLAGFPDRPVRIIVYTGPGGLIDFTARKFAEVARKHVNGQPIIVINKPGGGGIVAFEDVLQQPADGYNILAVTRSNISKIVSVGREDLIDEVDWRAYVMDNPHVVITNANSGLDTWDAVARHAEQRRGRQLWLGVDIGGVKHVSGLRVWEKTGIEARWIPFGSGGQAAAALLGNVGHVYFGNLSDTSGNPNLRIVGVCASERLAAFPDAPTFAEMGVPGLEDELIWRGFAMRKGTPEPVLQWFDDLVRKVHADPDWRSQWENEGINVVYKPAEEFRKVVEADRILFRETLKPLGLLRSSYEPKWLGVMKLSTAVNLGNLLLILLFGATMIYLARSEKRNVFGEVAVAVSAVLAAVSILMMSSQLPKANVVDQVGAAGVPRLWAFALLLLAGLQIFLSITKKPAHGHAHAGIPRDFLLPAFLVALLLYLLAMEILGYHIATLIFLPCAFWLLGFRKWLPATAITICWLCFAYFVFERALYVDLPVGWLMNIMAE
jgi:tripartite-type tricarboxylate transporter receptor subunit TctC